MHVRVQNNRLRDYFREYDETVLVKDNSSCKQFEPQEDQRQWQNWKTFSVLHCIFW